MITIFLVQAGALFLAFAYLYYFTTMTGNGDYRTLFTRTYLAMLLVLAIGVYAAAATRTPSDAQTGKTAAASSPHDVSGEASAVRIAAQEISHV